MDLTSMICKGIINKDFRKALRDVLDYSRNNADTPEDRDVMIDAIDELNNQFAFASGKLKWLKNKLVDENESVPESDDYEDDDDCDFLDDDDEDDDYDEEEEYEEDDEDEDEYSSNEDWTESTYCDNCCGCNSNVVTGKKPKLVNGEYRLDL